jgi:hypothetical protein
MTGNGLEQLLMRWRAWLQDRPAPCLLDGAWEDRVMAAVLARRPAPARAGVLDRLGDLAWAAWTAGAAGLGLGLVAALRLPLVGLALDRLSLVRTFYSFSSMF